MTWVLVIGVWLVVALVLALLVGRGVRVADAKEAEQRVD